MQTLLQRRMKHALANIERLTRDLASGTSIPTAKQLLNRTEELPFMILSLGLGQAAAFYKTKCKNNEDSDGYGLIYNILQAWLCHEQKLFAKQTDLVDAIQASDMSHYRIAQAEAIEYMSHLKYYAKAYF